MTKIKEYDWLNFLTVVVGCLLALCIYNWAKKAKDSREMNKDKVDTN